MYLDLLLLILVLVLAVRGAISGLYVQVFGLIALLAALMLAPHLAQWLQNQSMWIWLSAAPLAVLWIVSGILIITLVSMVGWLVIMAQKNSKPSRLSRGLGAGLGALKGLLCISLIGLVLQLLPSDRIARFDDFHRDISESKLLRMSQTMLTWDSLAFFQSLKGIKSQMEGSFKVPEVDPKGPWIPNVNPDSD